MKATEKILQKDVINVGIQAMQDVNLSYIFFMQETLPS
jgi:hypothetical protein